MKLDRFLLLLTISLILPLCKSDLINKEVTTENGIRYVMMAGDNWDQCNDMCNNYDSESLFELASIHSQEEFDWVVNVFLEDNTNLGLHKDVWIGLKYGQAWYWSDMTDLWGPIPTGCLALCACGSFSAVSGGTWHNSLCFENKQCFCKQQPRDCVPTGEIQEACLPTCGDGVGEMVIYKEILVPAVGGGEECEEPMSWTVPCDIPPCSITELDDPKDQLMYVVLPCGVGAIFLLSLASFIAVMAYRKGKKEGHYKKGVRGAFSTMSKGASSMFSANSGSLYGTFKSKFKGSSRSSTSGYGSGGSIASSGYTASTAIAPSDVSSGYSTFKSAGTVSSASSGNTYTSGSLSNTQSGSVMLLTKKKKKKRRGSMSSSKSGRSRSHSRKSSASRKSSCSSSSSSKRHRPRLTSVGSNRKRPTSISGSIVSKSKSHKSKSSKHLMV